MPRTRFLVLLLLPVALVACGDDGGGAGDEYAAAFAAAARDDESFGATEAESECLGDAVVDVVGVDELEKVTTPAEIRKDPEAELDDLGIDLDGDQADELADKTLDCVDGKELIERIFTADSDTKVDDEARECIDDAYDEDTFHDLLAATFAEGDEAGEDARFAKFFTSLTSCVSDESGSGGVFVDAIATELQQGSDLTKTEATCIAQEVVNTLGAEKLVDLGLAGDFEDAPAAAQQEVTSAIINALPPCNVAPSRLGN